MICWWCHRPITVKGIVNNVVKDTTLIGSNVRQTEQPVRCNSCGARYTVITYLDERPTVSKELLARLDNTPHP